MMEVATGGLYLPASGHQGLLEATSSWERSLQQSPSEPQKELACDTLSFELLASRAVKELIQVVVLCHGGLRKLVQHPRYTVLDCRLGGKSYLDTSTKDNILQIPTILLLDTEKMQDLVRGWKYQYLLSMKKTTAVQRL